MKSKIEEGLRGKLIETLRKRLLPVFLEIGFSCLPLPPEEANSVEMREAFPLGRLKRERNGKMDVVEIQFDKNNRPRFVINFGTVPEEGVTTPWGHFISRDEADPSGLPVAFRLYSSALRARWFEFGLFSAKNDEAIDKIADKSIKLSGEIKKWFEEDLVGTHMRNFGLDT